MVELFCWSVAFVADICKTFELQKFILCSKIDVALKKFLKNNITRNVPHTGLLYIL